MKFLRNEDLNMKIKLKRLRLRKGDILLVKKSMTDPKIQAETLMKAGKAVGLNFDVPIVFVEKLNDYKVKHGANQADTGQ